MVESNSLLNCRRCKSSVGSNPTSSARKVKPIGDGSGLENRRGVKTLGSSTLPPSVGTIVPGSVVQW